MNVYELKEKLTQFAEELNLNHSIIDAINSEVQGNERDPRLQVQSPDQHLLLYLSDHDLDLSGKDRSAERLLGYEGPGHL